MESTLRLLAIPTNQSKMRSIYFSARKRELPKHDTLTLLLRLSPSPRPILIIRLSNHNRKTPIPAGEFVWICQYVQYGPCFCIVHISMYDTYNHTSSISFLVLCPYHLMTFPISSVCAFTISPWKPVNQTIEFWPIEHISNGSTNLHRKTRLSLCVARPIFVGSSFRLCCLMQISTHFLCKWGLRSITFYDILDKYSFSSTDILYEVYVFCPSNRRSCLIHTTLKKLWVKHTKSEFFTFGPVPPRMSNKQRKLIRLVIPIDIWGNYYPFQKKYTRRKRFAANQKKKPWSWCVVHSSIL